LAFLDPDMAHCPEFAIQLISCSHPAPAGDFAAGLGREGSQKWGKATRRNNMAYK